MSNLFQPTALVGAIAIAMGFSVSAQANTDSSVNASLETLVITASRSEQKISEVPARINIIEPKILEQSPIASGAVTVESMPELPAGEPETTGRDDGVADRRAMGWELREAGWSNKRIARELGVHPSTVGRWFAVAHLTDTTDTAAEREETTP